MGVETSIHLNESSSCVTQDAAQPGDAPDAASARVIANPLEIAHLETISGFGPVKFYQLEARVHLNTVTWTYSRHTGLVIFAQQQEDEKGVIRPSGRKGD